MDIICKLSRDSIANVLNLQINLVLQRAEIGEKEVDGFHRYNSPHQHRIRRFWGTLMSYT